MVKGKEIIERIKLVLQTGRSAGIEGFVIKLEKLVGTSINGKTIEEDHVKTK